MKISSSSIVEKHTRIFSGFYLPEHEYRGLFFLQRELGEGPAVLCCRGNDESGQAEIGGAKVAPPGTILVSCSLRA